MIINKRTEELLRFCLLIGMIAFIPCKEILAQEKGAANTNIRPKITHGPYITAPSRTSVTITWKTNMPAHSKIEYGTGKKLTQVAEPQKDGFVPVDSLHTIHLTDLQPGTSYNYRVISTGVKKLKAYWPEKTKPVKGAVYSFSTFASKDDTVSFSFITDSQYEDVKRLNANLDLVDWKSSDFLVHGGDALSWVRDAEQVFAKFLDPITKRLDHKKPLVYVRGNHEMRGPYSRSFKKYVPNPAGKYYYTFNAGPVHFIVLDTGEDKADSTDVYRGLNDLKSYREKEFHWFKKHVETSEDLAQAPFRVILMHGPQWGWVDGEKEKWTALANKANIDLVIGGHWHRFAHVEKGKYGNDYPILVVDQDQVAYVKGTKEELKVSVTGKNGETIDSFTIE